MTSSKKRRNEPVASAEGLPEAPNSVAQVMLSVHLWTEGGNDAPVWTLAMAGDLLSASPCELREGPSSSIAASFLDTVQAVSAARRLMRLMQGFSQTAKAGRLQGCLILSTAEESNLEVDSQWKQLPSVLALAQNGLLLVVGSLYESARSIPGLQFEALSAESLTPEANSLYSPVMRLMPPSVECRPQVPIADEFASPALGAEMPVTGHISGVVPTLAAEPVMPAGQEITGLSRIQRSPGRTFPLRWVALGCAAVVMLAAIAFRFSGSRTSQHPVQTVLPSPPVAPIEPTSPGSAPPVRPVELKPVPKPGKPNPLDVAHAPKLKSPAPNPLPVQPGHQGGTGGGPTTVSGDKNYADSLSTEVTNYLGKAKKAYGKGDYKGAESLYQSVLDLDPNNKTASDGLTQATEMKKAKENQDNK